MTLSILKPIEEQYKFYAEYHQHPTNRLIHIVCIPTIVISSIALLSALKLTPIALGLLILYSGLNTYLKPDLIGSMASACNIGYYLIGSWLAVNLSIARILVIFFTAWVAQVLAHRFIEKNNPALTESIVQAAFVAPLFVIVEITEMTREWNNRSSN